MGFPKVDIHLDIVRQNAARVRALCQEHEIAVTGVTKCVAGDPRVAQAFLDAGIQSLGDSRVDNLKKLQDLQAEKWLLRLPMAWETEDVVRYAQVSLNSQWETIQALDQAAGRQGTVHGIVLMADLGDLREGETDFAVLSELAEKTAGLKHVALRGIGTNLSSFSHILPDTEKLTVLQALSAHLPMTGTPIVSGGNSAALQLMQAGGVPQGVNHFRLGESLLFGRERAGYTFLEGTRRDAFILSAQIVELKEKPSVPWGEVGADSHGRLPKKSADKGIRKRAVLALGRQDCDIETLRPTDPKAEILGATSDYLVVDVTDSKKDYRVGDALTMELGYAALMRVFTSPYVEKNYI